MHFEGSCIPPDRDERVVSKRQDIVFKLIAYARLCFTVFIVIRIIIPTAPSLTLAGVSRLVRFRSRASGYPDKREVRVNEITITITSVLEDHPNTALRFPPKYCLMMWRLRGLHKPDDAGRSVADPVDQLEPLRNNSRAEHQVRKTKYALLLLLRLLYPPFHMSSSPPSRKAFARAKPLYFLILALVHYGSDTSGTSPPPSPSSTLF